MAFVTVMVVAWLICALWVYTSPMIVFPRTRNLRALYAMLGPVAIVLDFLGLIIYVFGSHAKEHLRGHKMPNSIGVRETKAYFGLHQPDNRDK